MTRLRQLSPATALAAIALFVALTGTATAGGVALIVTSANIKNGTIKTVDLSPAARRALKGQRGLRGLAGPTGLPGPAGAPGPAGPAGPRGVANVKHYETGELTVPAGAVDGFGMSCPSGEGIVSGGGFASIARVGADHVAGNGWIFLVWNDSSIAVDIQGYITCAPGVTVGAVEHAVSATKGLELERKRLTEALD